MSILVANTQVLYIEPHLQQQQRFLSQKSSSWCGVECGKLVRKGERQQLKKTTRRASVHEESIWEDLGKSPKVEMEPIADNEQLDQALLKAQEQSAPILVDWMASWCRKCIYLKPKLEKMASEFDTKIKFYCVDVNNVPQTLVKRGNISKMPTIQVWKDGEMKAEVIGGHKAWLVVEEVREMINKHL